ncbi:MAG: hypothetical protein IJD63_01965 [Oscillospiraceae bacterium]|nr:hypothetical protein [Oscillospiraceae bacterium]
MKKITSVIAIVLLAALLFTGCDFIPMEKDFSQYGFKFTIAGKVEEKEENAFGDASFDTKCGELTFYKHNTLSLVGTNLLLMGAKYKEPVGDNATLYTFEATEKDSVKYIETIYMIELADGTTWQITFTTPEESYDKDALVKVFESVEFVTAA